MLETFVRQFRAHFPELVGRPLLVALSGGADSVALLHLLLAARDELACVPTAVHVHHHARGEEADADAAFCAALCTSLDVRFRCVDLLRPSPRGASREAHWREGRYRLLEQARADMACAATATAHTRDDQAETVLLKLLRGAGPRGVAGIRRTRETLIRPLLSFRREDLRRWLVARGAGWREDSSNVAAELPRVWVRRRLLPLVLEAFPASVAQLAAFADMLADDETVLGAKLERVGSWPEPCRPVPLGQVTALPRALRRRWLLELAARLPLAEPPSRGQMETVETMLHAGEPRAVDLGRRWVLRRHADTLRLSPPPCPPFARVAAKVPSVTRLPGGFVARLGLSAGDGFHVELASRVATDALAWRSIFPGERSPQPPGLRLGARLARLGIPPEWRRAWPVLEANGRMIWAPGAGVAPGWEGEGVSAVIAEVEEPWKHHGRS
jgi:tRNA(Ile)-lysidine synthase